MTRLNHNTSDLRDTTLVQTVSLKYPGPGLKLILRNIGRILSFVRLQARGVRGFHGSNRPPAGLELQRDSPRRSRVDDGNGPLRQPFLQALRRALLHGKFRISD